MNVQHLTDSELTISLDKLVGVERETVISILFHLIELDKRKLYREMGYSSLYDYCRRRLKYSEGSTHRRITAARCLSENPEVEGLLREGKVTLCTISTAAKSIQKEVTKIEDIVGRSKKEVEAIVSKAEPIFIKPRESIKEVTIQNSMPLIAMQSEERVVVKFSMSKEACKQFEEAKAKLSHSVAHDLSTEAVVTKLLEHFLKPAKVKKSATDTRYVPRSVKQAVYKRDQGQCCFQCHDGVRCSERHYLQIDHIVPFAAGGKTELENLRLLCPAHNQLLAETHFGKDFIQQSMHLHRRMS